MLKGLDADRRDLLMAVAATALTQLEAVFLDTAGTERVVTHVLLLACTAALAFRRRAPLLAAGVAFSTLALAELLPARASDTLIAFLFILFLAFTLGAYADDRRLAAGVAYGMVAVAVSYTYDDADDSFAGLAFAWVLIVFGPVVLGRFFRERRALNAALRERAERLDRSRSAAAGRAAEEERIRIAGELHDVVAHALGAMVVQAGAARRTVRSRPEQAGEAFAGIETTGREALSELRHVLGVLRRDEGAALAPQPSLAHVEALVSRAREAGAQVGLDVEGEIRPLPAGVDLAGYRAVQEALRRVLEAGREAQAHVRVIYSADAVTLEVTDPTGRAARTERDDIALGVRERVKVFGGELQLGTRSEGGWRLRARLPAPRVPA